MCSRLEPLALAQSYTISDAPALMQRQCNNINRQGLSLLKQGKTESFDMTVIQYLSFLWTMDIVSVRNHIIWVGPSWVEQLANCFHSIGWQSFVSRQPPSWWPELLFSFLELQAQHNRVTNKSTQMRDWFPIKQYQGRVYNAELFLKPCKLVPMRQQSDKLKICIVPHLQAWLALEPTCSSLD